jgi:DNA-binding transcriptional ArsR family regulator
VAVAGMKSAPTSAPKATQGLTLVLVFVGLLAGLFSGTVNLQHGLADPSGSRESSKRFDVPIETLRQFRTLTRHAHRCPDAGLIGKHRLAYSEAVTDVFKAIADPTRRLILDELTERDGQTLFEICARLATKHQVTATRQAVSQHLDVLERAGLVRTRREGRYKFHTIDTDPLEAVFRRWRRPDRRDPR